MRSSLNRTLCSVRVDVQEIGRSTRSADGVLVQAAGRSLKPAGATLCAVLTLPSERGDIRVALLPARLTLRVRGGVAVLHYPLSLPTAGARETANGGRACAVGKLTRQTTVWLREETLKI